ncbi:hypothetical protein ACFL12_06275 [Pseudomonadota bacterium]
MYDPGNVYLIGYALMFALAAVTLYFAKRALDSRGEKTRLTMKHVKACASAAGIMAMAGVAKVTVFADFYATHSLYNPI